MKLLRLINNNNKGTRGHFDTILNEDITIEPNSQIALHSLTCEIDTEQFIIDAQNDLLEFKMSDTDPNFRSIHLENGIFNSSNYTEVFVDLSLKMNKLLQYRLGEIGKQWEVAIDKKTKKVVFNCKLGNYLSPDNRNTPSSTIGIKNASYITSNGGSWGRNGGTASQQDAFLYMNSPQCKGASTFRGRIFSNPGTNDGYVIAYMKTPPNETTTLINTTDIAYGIRMTAVGHPYKIIVNGNETVNPLDIIATVNSSTVNDPLNDYLSIDASQGTIRLNIYRGTSNTPLQLFSGAYDHITNYYPVIIFEGSSSARISGVKFTTDPFYNVLNTITLETELESVAIPHGGGNSSRKIIKFNDADLALFFGFKETSQFSENTDDWILPAERVFTMSDFSDSFILVLDNLNIEAYDGLVEGHFNILHTIVQADIIRQRLTYTAPYPLFLSIRNPYLLKMRRFKCRLLREDLSEVVLTGLAQITLIIQNKNI